GFTDSLSKGTDDRNGDLSASQEPRRVRGRPRSSRCTASDGRPLASEVRSAGGDPSLYSFVAELDEGPLIEAFLLAERTEIGRPIRRSGPPVGRCRRQR